VIVPRSTHKQYSTKYPDLQPPYSYTSSRIASLEKTISPARLSTYQTASGGSKADAVLLYYWNIALGQSLHLPIQSVEVSLRNTISDSIESLFGQQWYAAIKFQMILTPWAKKTLKEAVKKTARNRRNNKPVTAGDVIANLTFGFWRELLKTHYDPHIWRKKLSVAFPNLPPTKNNQDVYNSVDKIIKLRNRISHHEPIIKGGLMPLYNSMLDTIPVYCFR